jgi:hypothetical protein
VGLAKVMTLIHTVDAVYGLSLAVAGVSRLTHPLTSASILRSSSGVVSGLLVVAGPTWLKSVWSLGFAAVASRYWVAADDLYRRPKLCALLLVPLSMAAVHATLAVWQPPPATQDTLVLPAQVRDSSGQQEHEAAPHDAAPQSPQRASGEKEAVAESTEHPETFSTPPSTPDRRAGSPGSPPGTHDMFSTPQGPDSTSTTDDSDWFGTHEAASRAVAITVSSPSIPDTLSADSFGAMDKAGFEQPTDEEKHADGSALLGRRVYVESHGAGTVLSFNRSLIGASSHTILLEQTGLEVAVKLQRKTNTDTEKLAWLIYPHVILTRADDGST